MSYSYFFSEIIFINSSWTKTLVELNPSKNSWKIKVGVNRVWKNSIANLED